MKNEKAVTVDNGLMAAMVAFDAVGVGDKDGYARAFCLAQRRVKDPIKQLAMVDCILAARTRAYGKAA